MSNQEIPIAALEISSESLDRPKYESILNHEIAGIDVQFLIIPRGQSIPDDTKESYKAIYLFVHGIGSVFAAGQSYEIVPETILLPNVISSITISADESSNLHCLKIISKLSSADLLDLKEFPSANTQKVYYKKFTDCPSYTEPIKSPNTISRTILPNKYIPRIAMGTVQTKGPDEVGAHEHPMLEQLFLGLKANKCTVYADDAQVAFPQYSVLHIPLGSRHSVTVAEGEILYYVWMDFFLDKKGEDWLKTHIHDKEA